MTLSSQEHSPGFMPPDLLNEFCEDGVCRSLPIEGCEPCENEGEIDGCKKCEGGRKVPVEGCGDDCDEEGNIEGCLKCEKDPNDDDKLKKTPIPGCGDDCEGKGAIEGECLECKEGKKVPIPGCGDDCENEGEEKDCLRCENGKKVPIEGCEPCGPITVDAEIEGRTGDGGRGEDLTINLCSAGEGATVEFTGSAAGEGCTFTYLWDFGDGGTSNAQNPSHEYVTPGTYDVTLTVSCQECSIEQTDTVQVIIEEGRTLDDIEADYRTMIWGARAINWDVAADNLEYFLSKAGGTRTISSDWLLSYSSIREAVDRNLTGDDGTNKRFEPKIRDEIKSLAPGQNTTFTDFWDATEPAAPLTELAYASGTSTVTSSGTFTISKSATSEVSVSGTVTHRWWDPYDWHLGLAAWVPFFSDVSDEDGLCMINAGRAKVFDMESQWTQTVTYDHATDTFEWR